MTAGPPTAGRLAAAAALAVSVAACATTGPAATAPMGDAAWTGPPPRVLDLRDGAGLSSLTAIAERLRPAGVIYVPETHGDAVHHAVQADVMVAVAATRPRVAAAVEWLPPAAQPLIDRYLSGALDEASFVREVRWAEVWGHPWEAYRPVFRRARALGMAIHAVGAPAGLARSVGRGGVDSLSAEVRSKLPRLDSGTAAHRAWFDALMAPMWRAHPGWDTLDPARAAAIRERYYLAQLVRDEVMAGHVARLRLEVPERTLIVLAGHGHIGRAFGIPQRAAAATGDGFRIIRPAAPGARDTPEAKILVTPAPYPDREADLLWEARAGTGTPEVLASSRHRGTAASPRPRWWSRRGR